MTEPFLPPMPARRDADPDNPKASDYWHFFRAMATNPLEMFAKVAYEKPVIASTTFGIKYASIYDPDAIRHYLVTNASNYRFDRLRQVVFQPILREGLLVAEDDLWQRTRRAITGVFTPRYVAGLADIMVEVAEQRVNALAEQNTGEVAMADEMVDAALDMLLDCMFAPDTKLDRARFTHSLELIFEKHSSPHFLDFLDAPKWMPRSGAKARDSILADLRDQLGDIVNARREQMTGGDKNENAKDLLSLLLRAGVKEGEPLTHDQVVDNLLTFLAAGHDTSARSMGWTFYLLSASEQWRTRVEDELDSVDLSAVPPAEWQGALPVLTAVLKESMRLYPAAGNISRVAVEADRLGGIDIEPGVVVGTAPWVLHRHKTLWDAPDMFDPTRFMGQAGDAIHRFAYLPFGAGPRVCLGASFAMQEMIIILATYLKKLRFHNIGSEAPMPIMQITIRPSTNMPMGFERR